MTTLVWLRDDLRLADNPALTAAAHRGEPVLLVYVLDEVSAEIRAHGDASRWWLHGSLESLGEHATLILKRGAAEEVIPSLVAQTGATAVFWNRRYSQSREIDTRLKERLRSDGIDVQSFQGSLMHEPWTLTTGSGGPYRVFTPFWKAALERAVRDPLDVPEVEWAPAASDSLADWDLLPTTPDWAAGLRESWHPGEDGAHEQLESFVDDRLQDYHRRDEPGIEATSHLSPHLRFGEISPFQIWHRMHGHMSPQAKKNVAKYLSEVGWREFNWNILFRSPHLSTHNYRPEFDAFPWAEPRHDDLEAWRHGRTGIPLVDAGMRELWHTGYMHNRVRMVTASLLTKNLLIDWRIGEQWFWNTLVDADEASNPGNWQWVAGSGADAAPYFRVFNPVLQASKFDPGGTYVHRWIPELDTPEYPQPIVDLRESRKQALDAYDHVRSAGDRR